jgi:serine/threonine protein kinase
VSNAIDRRSGAAGAHDPDGSADETGLLPRAIDTRSDAADDGDPEAADDETGILHRAVDTHRQATGGDPDGSADETGILHRAIDTQSGASTAGELTGSVDATGILPRDAEQFGPYLVYERLGQGGMATVHRAEKRGVGIRRPIALKRLLSHVAADPELVKLFVNEARLASHLHHANVAQTYELGKVDETFFIAMEYASGPTLNQIIRQCQKAAGEIPLTITVNILSQICEALEYAHNLCDEVGRPLRIIHRDVSPANIIVTNTGIVKLIDFGIAKATISSVKTQTGFIKGKFGYIAPEYISGRIDARVDLFAVGVIAHEMLAGRRLFEGKDDFETLANIREMKMQPPSRWNSHVTPDLDDIVMTALERDPDKRWQSAAAMQVALANASREFGLVVGSQQLVEWVEWAFSQVSRPSGPMLRVETRAGDTDAGGRIASAPGRRDSSVLIEYSQTPADTLDTLAPPDPRRAPSPSESDETVPLDRVQMAVGNAPPIPPPVPRTRARDSVLPPAPPPTPSSRTALSPDAAGPPSPPLPLPPPRPSNAVIRTVPSSREIEVIVVPPGGMFDTPAAPRNAEPAPEPAASPAVATSSRAPSIAPRNRHTVVWLILLMLALGTGAMAAAYYWPADF